MPIQASLEAAVTGIASHQLPETQQQIRAKQEAKAIQAYNKMPPGAPDPACTEQQRQAEQRPLAAAQCAEAHKPRRIAADSSLPRPLLTPLPRTPAPPPEEAASSSSSQQDKGQKSPRPEDTEAAEEQQETRRQATQ